jgi:hypothetical protein
MSDTIWKVEVSDEYLTFTECEKPDDFDCVAKEQPYGELNGTYCGHRKFGDTTFKLDRKLKASNYYNGQYRDKWGNFSLREWRLAFGFPYAWEPCGYHNYHGQLYATHVNFL